tara:strand:+ start:1259 stop:1630 length:372 start_codon:yes stop_codon:yes gene_type:complete
MEKYCPNCKEEIKGRKDKKFCNSYCKSNFHYVKNKDRLPRLYTKIDKQLKLNRRLLMEFNKSGKSFVKEEDMIKKGFDKKYFTHYWKNNKGEVYLFCYEYGFLSKLENGRKKFVLVTWQDYME